MNLRTRISLAGMITVAVVSFGVLALNKYSENTRVTQHISDMVRSQQNLWKHIVNSSLNKMRLNIATIEQNQDVIQLMTKAHYQGLKTALIPALNTLRTDGVLDKIHLTNIKGDIIYSTETAKYTSQNSAIAFSAIADGVIKQGLVRDEKGRITASIAFRLYHQGRIIGAGVYVKYLDSILQQAKAAVNAEIYIRDHIGNVAYATDKALWYALQLDQAKFKSLVSTVTYQRKAYTIYNFAIENFLHKKLAYVTIVSDTTEQYYYDLYLSWFLYSALVLIILGSAVGLYFYMKHIFKPVQHAVHTVSALARREYNFVCDTNRSDELGELFNAINILQGNMKQLDQLYRQVEDAEVRMSAILNNAADGIIVTDKNGVIITFNPTAEAMFQYTKKERHGHVIFTLLPAPFSEEYSNYYREHSVKKLQEVKEISGLKKNGETFPMEIAITEVKVNNQHYYTAFVKDITKRKEIDLKIQESERKYRSLVDNVPGVIFNRVHCNQWTMKFISDAVTELTGYPPHLFIDNDTLAFGSIIDPEDANIAIKDIERQLSQHNEYSVEYKIIHHDNTIKWVHEKGHILENEDDIDLHLEGVIHDISDMKFAQEELQQHRDNLEELVKTRTHELIEAKEQKERILEKANRELEDKVKERTQDLETAKEQAELASKSKSEFLSNISHELRTPLNSLLILANTLKKNKEQNLTDKQIEMANIIHRSGSDLLSLINEILDLAKIEAGKISIFVEHFTLRSLKDNMLQYFNPIAKDRNLAFSVDIDDVLPDTLFSDQQRIEQIIRNLLSNAFKFTHEGSITLSIYEPMNLETIMPECNTDSPMVAFAIKDTGIGISDEKKKLIFSAFQQADGSTSRKYGGTGLGLSISKEFSQLLGGCVTVESTEGKGSCFTLYLPQQAPLDSDTSTIMEEQTTNVMEDVVPLQSQPQPQPKPKPQLQPVPVPLDIVEDDLNTISPEDSVILVIEDDIKFLNILLEIIRSKGHKCLAATDGITGLQLASTHKPDAIIVDITLPGLNGLEIMDRLNDNNITAHIPVYVTSVHEETIKATEKGAVGYLTKPVTEQQLDNAIAKIEDLIKKPVHSLLIIEDNQKLCKVMQDFMEERHIHAYTSSTGEEALGIVEAHSIDCILLDIRLPGISGVEFLEKLMHDKDIIHLPIIAYSGKSITQEECQKLKQYAVSFIQNNGDSPEEIIQHLFQEVTEQIKSQNQEQNIHTDSLNSTDHIDSTPAEIPKHKPEKTPLNIEFSYEYKFKGRKILLVDDDMRNIFALTTIFEAEDAEIVTAKNGKVALDILESDSTIELVLMDMMMPVMDGYEAIKAIRQMERLQELPIIAVTAKAMQHDKDKCLSIGANDYISKPIDASELLDAIERLLL